MVPPGNLWFYLVICAPPGNLWLHLVICGSTCLHFFSYFCFMWLGHKPSTKLLYSPPDRLGGALGRFFLPSQTPPKHMSAQTSATTQESRPQLPHRGPKRISNSLMTLAVDHGQFSILITLEMYYVDAIYDKHRPTSANIL